MPESLHDLLTEPFLGTNAGGITLPELLAALSNNEQLEFTALQPHQQHAWFAFLVQLGALARWRTPDTMLDDAKHWTTALRLLTDNREEPWCLVVPDLSVPAFMQPPVPEDSLEKWKNSTAAPDQIDVLATAKNHDVKMERIDLAASGTLDLRAGQLANDAGL